MFEQSKPGFVLEHVEPALELFCFPNVFFFFFLNIFIRA